MVRYKLIKQLFVHTGTLKKLVVAPDYVGSLDARQWTPVRVDNRTSLVDVAANVSKSA